MVLCNIYNNGAYGDDEMGGPSPPFCTPHNGVYERLVYYHDRDRAERERQAEHEPNGRDRC